LSKITGQDKLLEKEVYPRLKKSIPFIVTGQRGIGKSEIIRWSFAHYLSDKAVYDMDENKIIHIPDQAEFRKAKIKVTEKDWHTLKLSGPSQLTKGTVYFKPGSKWHIAREGEYVFGVLQYEGDISLMPSSL
jgi:hypothetical protein